MFLVDTQCSEASSWTVVITTFPKNVDPSALPAVYGDARILAGDC